MSKETSSHFVKYASLDEGEIRLIDLGAHDEEPAIVHAKLESTSEYTAISYCWGAENCLHKFSINNQILVVTSSLLEVLVELQQRGYNGKIWADAVCINQGDDQEKAVQIPLMGMIYSNAQHVFAWLGKGSRDNLLSAEFVSEIVSSVSPSKDVTPTGSFRDHVNKWHLPPAESTVWADLAEMVSSTWFERVWTLQEAIVAQDIIFGFGRLNMPLSLLDKVQDRLKTINFRPDYHARHLFMYRDKYLLEDVGWMIHFRGLFRSEETKLVYLFHAIRDKKSTKPQDKVYGMYNLTTRDFRNAVHVDLHASTQAVFTRAAKVVLSLESEGLVPLSMGPNHPDHPKLSGLPSWVPDLNAPAPRWFLTRYHRYDAGRALSILASPHIKFEDGNDAIALLGFCLDSVERSISFALKDEVITLEDVSKRDEGLVKWIEDCLSATEMVTNLSGTQLLQKVGRVLVCDRPLRSHGDVHQRCSDTVSRDLQNTLASLRSSSSQQQVGYVDGPYFPTLCEFAVGCSFFITTTGYLGIGPRDLCKDDKILIIPGGEVPIAVRKRQSGSCLQVIGDCYVDGVMEGEAFDAYQTSGREYELILLD